MFCSRAAYLPKPPNDDITASDGDIWTMLGVGSDAWFERIWTLQGQFLAPCSVLLAGDSRCSFQSFEKYLLLFADIIFHFLPHNAFGSRMVLASTISEFKSSFNEKRKRQSRRESPQGRRINSCVPFGSSPLSLHAPETPGIRHMAFWVFFPRSYLK